MQPSYTEMRKKLNIEFVPCLDFNMIKNLENCLLVFDDSCEEIYDEKEFVKMAVSGRHKGVHVIFVKHNLFHQSKNSRTIDLNTTHIILFNSPRDVHQLMVFGKQLNKSEFVRNAYEKATEKPYGHLLIDLDPKTSDPLRYCSNIVEPGPSLFYLPSSKAVVTELHNEREIQAYIKVLARS